MRSSFYLRQNHKKAQVYLKSSLFCFKREKQLKYFIIIFSILFCLLGLIFSMLPQIMGKAGSTVDENIKFKDLCDNVVKIAGFCSGLFLVAQMFIKILIHRFHLEGVNAMERFDNYVYDIRPNKMITAPMAEAQHESYALKIKKGDNVFNNTYFSCETGNELETVYNNQREILLNEYHLMLFIKSKFFNWLYGCFFIGIFAFALAVNTNFFATLLNIFFPSISVISLIVSSILDYNKTMRFLHNTLNFFESAEKDRKADRSSETVIRLNQDAIFAYRMMAFGVPSFLIRIYDKSKSKQRRLELSQNINFIPKTSPFMDAAVIGARDMKKIRKSPQKKDAPDAKNAAGRGKNKSD